MPGGHPEAWPHVRPLLQAIAAKVDDGTPCCQWIGTDGAGHYVKMIHNGIEYADMQMICEAYALLREILGLSPAQLAAVGEAIAVAVGQPDMLSLPAFESRDARISHYEDVVAFLAPIFAGQTRDHWTAELTRLEVPNSPVYDSAEVLATEQAKVLGIEVSDPNGPKGEFRTIRFPPQQVSVHAGAMIQVVSDHGVNVGQARPGAGQPTDER